MKTTSGTPVMSRLSEFVIEFVKRTRSGRMQKEMKLVETLALGGKRQLMLVSCGDQRFLIGAGADGVQTIVAIIADEARR
jgi:flagellar biogenesis protein FliO